MNVKHALLGSSLAVILFVGGMAVERGTLAAGPPTESAHSAYLMRRIRKLRGELDRARAAAPHPDRPESRAAREAIEAAPDPLPGVRDAVTLRAELAEASAAGDGRRMLALLAELTALGEEHLPEAAEHWIHIVGLDAAALDALGLSRLALSGALAEQLDLIAFALAEGTLAPGFRQFSAETLEAMDLASRRAILDEMDFSGEKDKKVLHPLLRAARDTKDERYVDRFLHLVQRTDLYNDTRGSIAFMLAEIGGDESRKALDELFATGDYERIRGVLENIHAPPATGLLIVNAMSPTSDRIGLNDVLMEYNGHHIRSRGDLTVADSTTSPGDVVTVKVLRGGVEMILYVTVTDTAPGHLHFDSRAIVGD